MNPRNNRAAPVGVSFRPLDSGSRAQLFSQLAAMEKAGLSVITALGLLRVPSSLQPRLMQMRSSIESGSSLAEAGLSYGMFSRLESMLLHAASESGQTEHVYQRLSTHYSRRAARAAAMKSRMALPLAMLVIGILVGPLPLLAAGTLTTSHYLLKCLLQLSVLAGCIYLLIAIPLLQSSSSASGQASLDRLLQRLPLFGAMHVRRNVRDFMESLALLIEAGMPILQALPVAADAIQSREIKQRFTQIKPRIERGASFSQALGELQFAGQATASALISAGETSGALPEMLFRYAEGETGAINRFDESVAEWTPRIIYTLAALSIGYAILHSGVFMPSLPPELQ